MKNLRSCVVFSILAIMAVCFVGCTCGPQPAKYDSSLATETVAPPPPPVVEKEPPPAPAPAPTLAESAAAAGALQNIYFAYDKSSLVPASVEKLDRTAAWMQKNPQANVEISGHCDERGTNEYNMALGERRANSAKKYLVSMGIASERLSTMSYGEERPADPGHDDEAWAKNRRDELQIVE